MKAKTLFAAAAGILFLAGCQSSSEPVLHVYVANLSKLQKQVDIQVAADSVKLFDSTVNFSVNPYKEYKVERKLINRKYNIVITADSGKIRMVQPIDLEGPRYVYVTFTFGNPADSISGKAAKEGALSALDLNKPSRSMNIFVTDEKPGKNLKADSSFHKWVARDLAVR